MFFRCFFCTVRLSIFERFVFPKGSKFNRLVWDSLEIWKCGLYIFYNFICWINYTISRFGCCSFQTYHFVNKYSER